MQAYSLLINELNAALIKEQEHLTKCTPAEMYEPMNYIVGLGGKRVRPLLTLVGCDLFDVKVSNAIPASLAVELFHNFSLIHDDILDNAPLRRGSATVHEKWNTNIAILSGDGMLVKAFQLISKALPQHIHPLLQLFSKTGIEVCEGQQLDMNFETLENVSVNNYINMITYKTAVLLGCSLQMGAICADASVENQTNLYEFGKHVGIAFQILDDVLDVFANDDKFGKQVGGDIISNKKTFLLLTAFEIANNQQKEKLANLLADKAIVATEKVKQVTDIYNALDIKNRSIAEANKHTDIALTHLSKVNANVNKKENLKQFALQLLNREV